MLSAVVTDSGRLAKKKLGFYLLVRYTGRIRPWILRCENSIVPTFHSKVVRTEVCHKPQCGVFCFRFSLRLNTDFYCWVRETPYNATVGLSAALTQSNVVACPTPKSASRWQQLTCKVPIAFQTGCFFESMTSAVQASVVSCMVYTISGSVAYIRAQLSISLLATLSNRDLPCRNIPASNTNSRHMSNALAAKRIVEFRMTYKNWLSLSSLTLFAN